MAFSMLVVFIITLLISFIGSLPFGPINLVMIDTTLKHRLRQSCWFAVAAALVEMGQSLVALQGSAWLNRLIYEGPWVKVAGFVFFMLLGGLFYFKKEKQTLAVESPQRAFFLKGLTVASLNPQAIPFWVIVLALVPDNAWYEVSAASPGGSIFGFMLGAAGGKLGALLLFGILSERIIQRSALLRTHINRIIGIILISIGMFQGILAIVG